MEAFQSKIPLWPRELRLLTGIFMFCLISGVSVGIIYLAETTHLTPRGTVEHYVGSTEKSKGNISIDIPENYPKLFEEMLLTTHNHILSMAVFFFLSGGLFYFSSFSSGKLKSAIMVEPLVSVALTFGGLWGVRYIDSSFVYLVIPSAAMMYMSFYFSTFYVLRDCLRSPNQIHLS